MFCSQCGTAVANDASFCHKCGKPVPLVAPESVLTPAHAPIESIQPAGKAVGEPAPTSFPPFMRTAPTLRQRLKSTFVATILMVAVYALTLVPPTLIGEYVDSKTAGWPFTLVSGYAFWHLWKRLNRRAWIGAFVGVVISILAIYLQAFAVQYVRGQPSYILDHEPVLAALKKNFPQVAEQLRQEVITASGDRRVNPQELLAKLQARILPVAFVAMKTTSDAAMLQYAKAKIQQSQEVADANPSDCVSLMLTPPEGVSRATQAKIIASTSKETLKAVDDAFVKILNDADTHRNAPAAMDEKRFNTLIAQLDAKLKSTYGTSAYYFADDSENLPSAVRCKAGLLLFREALNLPEKDRSFMLTTLFASELGPR